MVKYKINPFEGKFDAVASNAKEISIPQCGSPTWTSVYDALNLINSTGRATGGEVSLSGGSVIYVQSGTGFMKATDDDTAELCSSDWIGSYYSIPDDTIKYVGMEYTIGEKKPVIRDTETSFDFDTDFPLAKVVNEGGTLHILNNPWWTTDGMTNIIERLQAEGHVVRDDNLGGLIISDIGTRNISVTAGQIWSRLNEFPIAEVDTSVTGTVELYYYSTDGGWTDSDVTQWDKLQWNDTTQTAGNELVNLSNNWYANVWVYAEADDAEIALLYPQAQYANAASAETEAPPSNVPVHISENAILLGRYIIKQNTDTPIEVQTVFDTVFTASQAADHGNLAGLSGDDHSQYILADGTRPITGLQEFKAGINTSGTDITMSGGNIYSGNDIFGTMISGTTFSGGDIHANYLNLTGSANINGELHTLSNDVYFAGSDSSPRKAYLYTTSDYQFTMRAYNGVNYNSFKVSYDGATQFQSNDASPSITPATDNKWRLGNRVQRWKEFHGVTISGTTFSGNDMNLAGDIVIDGTVDGRDISDDWASVEVISGAGVAVSGATYAHIQDNSQAHTDYTLNTGDQIDGDLIIDNTSTEALLVRQNADAADVLTVDTTNEQVIVGGTGSTTIGGGAIINNGGGDSDTQVKGNSDDNLIYVDAGNDRVGIGDSTPSDKLEVAGAVIRNAFYQGQSTTSQTCTGPELDIEFDADTRIDTDYYTHSITVNPEQITIDTAGWYKISYNINLDQDVNDRREYRGYVQDDGTPIAESYSYVYLRTNSEEGKYGTLTATFLVNVAASSVLKLSMQGIDTGASWGDVGAADADTLANQTWVMIEKV